MDTSDNLDEKLAALREAVENPGAAAAAKKKRPRPTVKPAVRPPVRLPVKSEFVKSEFYSAGGGAAAPGTAVRIIRSNPDWTGAAAPNTPAAISARQWVASRGGVISPAFPEHQPPQPSWGGAKGKGKGYTGKGPRPRRSMGIESLDESCRLHGADASVYGYGQHARLSDSKVHLGPEYEVKQEEGEGEGGEEEEEPPAERRPKAPKLPKGTPTLAPMCPAPDEVLAADDL